MGGDLWYENPYLKTVWQHDRTGYNPTDSEARISLLYGLWKQNTMPWMWDHENYPDGKDDEMYGVFYPEDFNTILQISHFESKRKTDRK